jgi:hypothetical protein
LEDAQVPAVKIRADRYWLQQAWESTFSPSLNMFASHIMPLVFAHLQKINLLLRSQGVASDGWDPLAYSRPAIEQHEQNEHGLHDAFNVLIDAARDTLDWLLREDLAMARHYIEMGLSMAAPLIQRLCIYGLARHPDVTANKKIAAVVEGGWLGQGLLRHEVFQLLRASYKESGIAIRRRLLRTAEGTLLCPKTAADDTSEDTQARHHQLFTLLVWLEESDPSCTLVAKALGRLRKKYPGFKVSDYPDFGHWSHGVQTVQTVSPIPSDALLRLDPPQWIDEYAKVMTARRDIMAFEDPVQGFLLETETAASENFDWGFLLLWDLAARGMWDHAAWHYVLRSWARQPLTEPQWNELLSFVQQHQELFRHAGDIADMLLRRLENRERVATEDMVIQAYSLAESLWRTIGPEEENEEKPVSDWVQYGINRAGGKLGLFTVHALSRLRTIQADEWKEIPNQLRPLLDTMANASDKESSLARPMLCSQLHFFFAIDTEWTTAILLPLFDWDRNRQVAVQAWHGFLAWGRVTRQLLTVFMPYVIQTFDHLAELKGVRPRFSEYLASIAFTSEFNPVEAGWIREYLRRAATEDRREWASSIDSILGDIDKAERHVLWEAWLRKHIENRLESEIPIDDSEWSTIVSWSLKLGEDFPEMVELLGRRPAKVGTADTFYYQLHKHEDLVNFPNSLADLLSYLLAAEERLYHKCDYVEKIIEKLIDSDVARQKLLALAERLGELGCADAQQLASRIESSV